MKENIKYIIIAVAVIISAFILKPERSAKDDCYYENKKWEMSQRENASSASREALQLCD